MSSQIPAPAKAKVGRRVLLRVLSLTCLLVCVSERSLSAAEEHAAESGGGTKPPQIKSDEPLSRGVIYGELVFVHPKKLSIVMSPVDTPQKRIQFFLDPKTGYFADKKPQKYALLKKGDRVAIHFIGQGRIKLADNIYVVRGDFDPANYLPRKKAQKSAESKASH